MCVDLKKLLTQYSNLDPESIREETITGCVLSFLQLRDKIYGIGKILYEDQKNQVYVASICSGFGNLDNTVIAMQLCGNRLVLVGFAKEGVIKQHICENAFLKLKDAAIGGDSPRPSGSNLRRFLFVPITIIVVIIVAILIIDGGLTNGINFGGDKSDKTVSQESEYTDEVQHIVDATKRYNRAVEQYNLRVAKYNEIVQYTCVDNISGLPTLHEMLATESEDYADAAAVLSGGKISKEIIVADTNIIYEMIEQIEQDIAVIIQITAPSETWVIERLGMVDSITGFQAVTEGLDPDGLLGKAGGFSACVYFTVTDVNANEIPGNSIVAKGTDAGGAVEVYPTLADAETRCEYLAGFDDTIFYSGSYAIVGTMVIRTSYKLTNEQQFTLTDAITNALTACTKA